jgi:dimethylglycine dehydrogenase
MMKTQARAVVIGGGVVGVSMLYHLAKKGWTDSILIERKELTSGSTWHAAGLLPLFNMSYSVGQVHKYSVKFYQELEKETGMNVGFRNVSNIRLASTPDRWDEYMQYAGVAFLGRSSIRMTGISSLQISPRLWPRELETGAPQSTGTPP